TNHVKQIAPLAAHRGLPSIFGVTENADEGGLMVYSADFVDLERRAATFVDKLIKGAKPGDLPVEQPTKFELVINLKTAKALVLALPPALLRRADRVIDCRRPAHQAVSPDAGLAPCGRSVRRR